MDYIDSMDTLGSIEHALPEHLRNHGVTSLTLSTLTGDDRTITVPIASWARTLVLDTGERAYAYWLRRVDEGATVTSESITADTGTEMNQGEAALKSVAERFGLHIH